MEREASKRKEYAERTKMDVKQIMSDMTDKEIHEMRVADRDQDSLFTADPARGELLSADQSIEGDDDEMDDEDEY